ncbi:hypothetical protein ETH_00004370, partial [Eimeria tenella]
MGGDHQEGGPTPRQPSSSSSSSDSSSSSSSSSRCKAERLVPYLLRDCLGIPVELLRLDALECYRLASSSSSSSSSSGRRACCPAACPGRTYTAGAPPLPFSRPLHFISVPLDCPEAARLGCLCSSEAAAALTSVAARAAAAAAAAADSSSYRCSRCSGWLYQRFYPCYFPVNASCLGCGAPEDVGAFLAAVAGSGIVSSRAGIDPQPSSARGAPVGAPGPLRAKPHTRGALFVSPSFAYAADPIFAPYIHLQ